MNTLEIEVPGGTLVVPVDELSVVEVETQPGFIIVPFDNAPTLIEVVAQGPQGPQGPQGIQGQPGNATIGGFDVDLQGIGAGDVLAFSGSVWTNKPQQQLTDGGNF